MAFKIQLNEKGTHSLDITEENMKTIQKYKLFDNIVDSTGYVDEQVLNKLKFNVRSLIVDSNENTKELLDLCIDVIYNDKMKAYGLQKLMEAYNKWSEIQYEQELTPEV